MLIVVFGLTRFHTYTYGRKVTAYNDHKPLTAVLKRPVEENPIQLQRVLCPWHIPHDLSHSQPKQREIETIGLVIQGQSVTSHLTLQRKLQRKFSYSQ